MDTGQRFVFNMITSPKRMREDIKQYGKAWENQVTKLFKPTFGIEIEITMPYKHKLYGRDSQGNIIPFTKYYRNTELVIEALETALRKKPAVSKSILNTDKFKKMHPFNRQYLIKNSINEHMSVGSDCGTPELRMFSSIYTLSYFERNLIKVNKIINTGFTNNNLHIHIPQGKLNTCKSKNGETVLKKLDFSINNMENNKLALKLFSYFKQEYLKNLKDWANPIIRDCPMIRINRQPSILTYEYRGFECSLNYTDVMKKVFLASLYDKAVIHKRKNVEKYFDLLPLLFTF